MQMINDKPTCDPCIQLRDPPTAEGRLVHCAHRESVNHPWPIAKLMDKDKEQNLPIYRFTLVAAKLRNISLEISRFSVSDNFVRYLFR